MPVDDAEWIDALAKLADTREVVWLDALPPDHELNPEGLPCRGEAVYRGWIFYWTGWKYAQDIEGPAAQWCGARVSDLGKGKPEMLAYSCFPGGTGFIGRGQRCDGGIRDDQREDLIRVTRNEPGARDRVKDSELQRFLRFIDSLEDAQCSNA